MDDRVPSGRCLLLVLAAAVLVTAVVAGGASLLHRGMSEEEVLLLGAIVTLVGLGVALQHHGDGGGDGLW